MLYCNLAVNATAYLQRGKIGSPLRKVTFEVLLEGTWAGSISVITLDYEWDSEGKERHIANRGHRWGWENREPLRDLGFWGD